MNDGIGGATVLALIVFFVVIFSSYMAFNVNYTKAFRVKNKVIDCFNKYGTACRNVTDKRNKCNKEIEAYAKSIGYMPDNISCGDDFSNVSGNGGKLFCVKGRLVNKPRGGVFDQKPKCSYKVVTKINISIPIIDSLLSIDVFKVKGDTKSPFIIPMILENDHRHS